jgi:hypothetical protein
MGIFSKKNISRRGFLRLDMKEKGQPTGSVSMLTADGKLVYIDKEIVSQAPEGNRASNKEILEWMKNPSKKEE